MPQKGKWGRSPESLMKQAVTIPTRAANDRTTATNGSRMRRNALTGKRMRLPEQRERAERQHAPERRITAVEGCRSVGDGAHESLIPSTQLYAQRSRQS